jgi:hypothetical protein
MANLEDFGGFGSRPEQGQHIAVQVNGLRTVDLYLRAIQFAAAQAARSSYTVYSAVVYAYGIETGLKADQVRRARVIPHWRDNPSRGIARVVTGAWAFRDAYNKIVERDIDKIIEAAVGTGLDFYGASSEQISSTLVDNQAFVGVIRQVAMSVARSVRGRVPVGVSDPLRPSNPRWGYSRSPGTLRRSIRVVAGGLR